MGSRKPEEEQYTGSYRTVVNHYRRIRAEVFQEHDPAIPLTHIPGEAQADFGEADYYQHGQHVSGATWYCHFQKATPGFYSSYRDRTANVYLKRLSRFSNISAAYRYGFGLITRRQWWRRS
jgi:hypothetical protein